MNMNTMKRIPEPELMETKEQARAYAASGDAAKARESAQSALALNPSDSMAAAAHTIIGDSILADAQAKGKLDRNPVTIVRGLDLRGDARATDISVPPELDLFR